MAISFCTDCHLLLFIHDQHREPKSEAVSIQYPIPYLLAHPQTIFYLKKPVCCLYF